MKKSIVLLGLLLVVIGLSAQSTIEIGNKLVASTASTVHSIIKNDVSYYHFHINEKKKTVVSLEIDSAVYVYKIFHSDNKVIINYRHDNQKHLRELEEVIKQSRYSDKHIGNFSTDIFLY
jgi:hypothetical protein